MANNAKLILGWLGFVLNLIICVVLAVGINQVYPKRRLTYWSARHFGPMIVNIYWSILFVLIERNLQLFGGILGYFSIGYSGGWIITNIFGLTFFAFYIKRAWIIHFDYNAGLALFIQKTNLQLAQDFDVEFRWFLDNKSHYGSPNYLYRFTIAVSAIMNLILIGWVKVSPSTFEYGLTVIYAVLIIVAMGTTKKITHLDDNFFIRDEILYEFRALAVYFFIAGGLIIFGPAMGWEWCKFFLVEFSCICIGIMGYISTFWVLKRAPLHHLEDSEPANSDTTSSQKNIINNDSTANLPPFDLILSSGENCALFIKHLVREISVENIFFIADVMAYKKAFITHRKLNRDPPGFMCQVPTQLARYHYVKDRTFVHYAWSISKIYVDGSSIFYVTAISDETRRKLLDFVEEQSPFIEADEEDKVDYEKLCTAFDDACTEVYRTLKSAYLRFSKTPEFNEVLIEQRQLAPVNLEMIALNQKTNQ